jgi:hypothetical protein
MRLRARNWLVRPTPSDDPVSFGSPQLQIFQEFPRTADELHVIARRKPKGDGDFPYEGNAVL